VPVLSAGQAGLTPNKKMQRHGFQGRSTTLPPQSVLFPAMSVSHTGAFAILGGDLSSFSTRFPNLKNDSTVLRNGSAVLCGDSAVLRNVLAVLQSDFAVLPNGSAILPDGLEGWETAPQHCNVAPQYCEMVQQYCEMAAFVSFIGVLMFLAGGRG